MDLPDWVEDLWAELRFRELLGQASGEGFQRLVHQIMKAVDGDDFMDVRPVGKHGDFTCDGWGMQSRTCYAIYGPFKRKSPGQVRHKIEGDLFDAVQSWPEMQSWRLVHNDLAGLNALVAAALVSVREEVRTKAPHLEVLPPWGPRELWWLLRQAPAEARRSILGTHGWRLSQDRGERFVGAGADPVSVSAVRSVTQLLDGFAAGGVVEPLAACTFVGAVAMFLLGDEATFRTQSSLLEQRCHGDPFETMLTSVVFCVKAVQLWEAATGDTPQLWADMLVASTLTIPYVIQIVLSARLGTEAEVPLPGHPEDQQKVIMSLGQVTAMTLQLTADHRADPLVSILQDLLIGVQRERPGPPMH
ncbi:hypothetical protein [Amycolatopsis sp. NPDC051061]|uniref:hypothetical protein n=1 Tax=Amycolatopsis sp. NPDC051061 TaxID=3155042 RepID=UPI003428F28E